METEPMSETRRPIWVIPAAAGVACLLVAVTVLSRNDRSQPRAEYQPGAVRTSGEAQVGGAYELVRHDGRTVTDADFHGRPQLIYFGFTYCPDVCPMSLQVMKAALDRLPDEQAAQFQPILISVDPERDTPESLAQYVTAPAFPEGLVGLTGSPEQVRQAADAYRVWYQRAGDDGVSGDYLVDHSSLIYLMDRQGDFVEVFPHSAPPEQIAARLERFLEEERARS
jgi:cytochrome oxidase Cu insertion factor (SCO1/SenC/PrrC family)